MIPYGKQDISQQDIDAVVDILESDYLTQGPAVPRFERELTAKVGAEFGVATNSATSALHIACMALDLSPGDSLWTSPITFVASANCARYCGADVDFVDIHPLSYNLDADKLEEKLALAKTQGKLPKIVVAVHLAGQPCDMGKIKSLSDIYGFRIIEDASHAVGARYKNQTVGNGKYSDITIFSFHPVKIMTTAEGGMALTNESTLYKKMLLLRSHGITREHSLMTEQSHGAWYYQQLELGYNYRMSDIHAALGISQLKRLEEFVEKRTKISQHYIEQLKELPIELPQVLADRNSSWHLFIILVKLESVSVTHGKIFNRLRDEGLGVNLHYIPVYKQPYYREHLCGDVSSEYPVAEHYYSRAISLPIYSSMKEGDVESVIETMKSVFNKVI